MDLQKAPLGFLGAFQLKVGGRNPPLMSDAVVPVADVYDQYLPDQLAVQTITQASGLVTFMTMTFQVPAGKAWRVLGASADIGLNVADVAIASRGVVGLLAPDAGVIGCNLWVGASESGAGVVREVGLYFARPLFLSPQWRVTLTWLFNAALTVTANAHAALLRQEFDV